MTADEYQAAIVSELQAITRRLATMQNTMDRQARTLASLADRVIIAISDASPAPRRESLWAGQGGEEPPAHVTKIRDADGDIFNRGETGEWSWAGNPSLGTRPWSAMYGNYIVSPYVEVRDGDE